MKDWLGFGPEIYPPPEGTVKARWVPHNREDDPNKCPICGWINQDSNPHICKPAYHHTPLLPGGTISVSMEGKHVRGMIQLIKVFKAGGMTYQEAKEAALALRKGMRA